MSFKKPIQLILAAAAVALLVSGINRAQSGSPAREGKPIDFTLTDVNGKTVNLSDFKSKPVLLDVFAHWCPPCNEEAPHLENEIHRKYGEKIQVIGVATFARGDAVELAKEFKDKHGLTYPMLVDRDNKIAEQLGVQVVPTNFILDENHNIVATIVGFDADAIEQQVSNLAKK
ncbi:MAG: TlpA family protein disulfide reductase [Armatimonadetes bacterium]|nr:TlpA family protein disulfide reductase [Armatimonadota bacterium]